MTRAVLALLLCGCIGAGDGSNGDQGGRDGGRAQGGDGGAVVIASAGDGDGAQLADGGRAQGDGDGAGAQLADAGACSAVDMFVGVCGGDGDGDGRAQGDGDGDGDGAPCEGCPEGYPPAQVCEVGAPCQSCPAGCNPNPLTPGQADIFRCADGQTVTCQVCICP